MRIHTTRLACGSLRLTLVASLMTIAAGVTRAADGTPPPRWECLAELMAPTVASLEQLRRGGTPGLPDARVLARCAERVRTAVGTCARGRRPAALGCAHRLTATAIALDAAANPSTGAGAFVAYVAAGTARVATLLRVLERSRDACADDPTPDAPVPGILGWRAGGAHVEVEPARPLLPGTRHRLVIDPDLEIIAIQPALDARGRLAGGPTPVTPLPSLAEYDRRVLRDATSAPGLTTRPVFTLQLARPIPLTALASVSVAFEPIGLAADATGIVVTTLGASLVPDVLDVPVVPPSRDGTRAIAPDERTAFGLAGPPLSDVALRLGTFASRDPVTGSLHDVPYIVAIPPRPRPDVAVLLLDGLGGSAARFLRIRGASLLAQGLTLVAMDLPAHGMRQDGRPFFDVHDPSLLAERLAAGAADVVALGAHLRTTAALAPTASSPTRIGILGYSIGAAAASVALALDPTFGAAVLIAPPGDLTDFLGVSASASFGAPLLRCLRDGELGGACGGDDRCAGGACVLNPVLLPLLDSRLATRTVLAPADPQTRARAIAGPTGSRPVLIQIGGRDGIVTPDNTIWLAAALGADLTCTHRAARPQVLCRFPEAGHNVFSQPDARRQADTFLLSGGTTLTPSGDAWAAR